MQNNFATLKLGSFLRGGIHWFARRAQPIYVRTSEYARLWGWTRQTSKHVSTCTAQ